MNKDMTIQQIAAKLDGREYGSELSDKENKNLPSNVLVVFGCSDDLVELRGFEYEEIGAYDGTTFSVDAYGLVQSLDDIDTSDEEEVLLYAKRKDMPRITIKAEWCPNGTELSWLISNKQADVSTASFTINEDGEPFCQGLVIDCTPIMHKVTT